MAAERIRQVIIDTETTGLEVSEGHRIIEIGCVEMINRRLTDCYFHYYLNPQRSVGEDSLNITGINDEFLKDKPLFDDVAEELYMFIKDAELIAHNAPFDVGFLNHEFELIKFKKGKISDYCKVTDTLPLARRLHPGQRNSLDALCKRYDITSFDRTWHGALLDAKILAQVYLAMTSGQMTLSGLDNEIVSVNQSDHLSENQQQPLKIIYANDEELALHENFLQWLKKNTDETSVK